MILHHRIDGPESSAHTVVFVNSLGTNLELWDDQAAALSRRFRIVRYDQRGHGRSPAPAGPYTVADLGSDLLELLDRLDLERVSLCGLSLGGAVASWLAVNAPERIYRLALCCTAAQFATPESWRERAALVRAGGMEELAELTLGRWFTDAFRAAEPAKVARYRAMLAAMPVEGYAGCCEALGAFDLRSRLGSITAPTLVVTGSDDPSITPARGDELAAAIPGARHVVLTPASHLANVEQPIAFTRALLEHLDAAS